MENIEITGYSRDYFIPAVSFDAETGTCSMKGEIYIEDAVSFFAPLIKWIDKYIADNKGPITFNFELQYFNTSASKRLLDILFRLKAYKDKGNEVTANWIFDEEDPDIEEDVNDFNIITQLEINKIFK